MKHKEEKQEVLTPLSTEKVLKYYKARNISGLNKKESSLAAGYKSSAHASRVEASPAYQNLDKLFRNKILEQITLDDLAKINIENASQRRDLSSSNMALKLLYERVLDERLSVGDEADMLVLLKGDTKPYRIK